MNAVRSNNFVTDMYAANRNIIAAIFAVSQKSVPRVSTVPLETRRHAVVPRSAPGPVLDTMLKNWPMDRMVSELVSLRAAQVKANHDHDVVALEVIDREFAKLAGLCEEHDKRDANFSKRMWDKVGELTKDAKLDAIEPTVLNVMHGSNEPGTLGAELSDELRVALFNMTQSAATPQAEATPAAPAADDADEVVRKAMEELANNQQSTI